MRGLFVIRMKKPLTTILFLLLLHDVGMACRFTVREIGFADFGKDSYQFVLFKDGRISDADAKLFKNISYAALLDANITVQVIDVQKDSSSPLLEYYTKSGEGKLPNVILVSPEERAKAFWFDGSEDFTQTVWSLLEKVVTSNARDLLMENIIKSFGVVYFIEGDNAVENNNARKMLEEAIEEIKLVMMSLPKPVHIPPAIITIKANERADEDVLLWSLGWEKADLGKPAVALIYGRGRRMGPMLKGDKINKDVIRNMLRFIGEDCECGLDRSWMLGTMIPMRWDSKLKAAVLSQYGFDADNPMIISEMSQILSVAPERTNNSIDTDLLYGYSESILHISDSSNSLNVEPIQIDANESSQGINKVFSFILLGFLGIISIGVFIFIRAKRRNS